MRAIFLLCFGLRPLQSSRPARGFAASSNILFGCVLLFCCRENRKLNYVSPFGGYVC